MARACSIVYSFSEVLWTKFTDTLSWAMNRTYHAYRAGSYMYPNDEPELDRLDMQHELLHNLQGAKHFLAPICPTPHNILDVGCGTGKDPYKSLPVPART